ncbi:Rv1733c family protein [Pseudonocardia bannensis]|uniref:Integral membrane protein n=1 Tax=Pseudonocardia bannensis TaxID=630973 RepID=A0A848DSM0_9PSEU|nr:hypothetical protein [Pseudonocardia bannensis]NMH95406.1 hypothetical protein [Pseudonocardia bannensis]
MRADPDRLHPPAGGRMPRRRTDRLEDVLAWLAASLVLLTLVAAIVAGSTVLSRELDRAERERGERTPVRAVLLEESPMLPVAEGSVVLPPARVPAKWTGTDGAERTGLVTVHGMLRAGTPVRVWVDPSGALVGPPASAASASIVAIVAGAAILGAGWGLLAGVWIGLRRWIEAHNAVCWAREWDRVGPEWTRRFR